MKQTLLIPAQPLATLFLIILILIGHVAGAQEAKPSFTEKRNQLSLAGELAVSVSFSYAHRFSRYAVFGFQAQGGVGLRYLLNNPTFPYMCDQCTEYYKERLRSISLAFIEIAKLQLFYRLVLNNHFYLDMGPYASIGINSIEAGVAGPSFGLELSGYYTTHGFFIGLRFQGGYYFTSFRTNINHNYFGMYLTPMVVGVNF